MDRTLKQTILSDLPHKIILVSGPRQVGKTTLAKSLDSEAQYLNYDESEDRLVMAQKAWNPQASCIIFDELHKMPDWKRWIKGIYDTRGIPPHMVVTGSAKLDTYRKVGDSLAGRYFSFRLHPLDIKEVTAFSAQETFGRLLSVSGFPEPFLKNKTDYYGRWARTHQDIILRQDLLDLERITDIHSIERLIDLMSRRVGSTVSYANLARDLQRDPKTIKKWIGHLEDLYILFSVKPFSNKIARAHLKEPKYYFYNTAFVKGDNGTKFENLVACALLKEVHYLQDTQGMPIDMAFLRTKDGKEIDFVITKNNTPSHLIECKWSDSSLSKAFSIFSSIYPQAQCLQLVAEGLTRSLFYPEKNTAIHNAPTWLSQFSFG